ncbi:Putative protein-S-isoprenylcysteine methyltransferase [Prochlorococcus marinus str. MIT 9515]|uniref:Isoprenylcysteine carboxylmethyltransferase family protein n=1 Tax=Prochlorococcus marinus (strain MIT 9515) TaxID=167542 RepID=A2BX91_PROM5|nr:isoprenylcysteine carboxylmethyltransferase family protein [Prochlorococcus marinus]ABM72402.1 Putative protein-S-isoprenylcysteine methyltransferase [Prochlorococcus marinus str. MIT 9515]
MSKLNLKVYLKTSNEIILVILQFFIIILHFIEYESFPKIKLIQDNSKFSFVGYIIVLIASIVLLIAIKDLGRNLSPFPTPIANGNLITTGIYRLIRHPMYYSIILISFGFFLIKLSFYYLCLTLSLILIIKFKISLEDQYLKNKFKDYILYKDKVKY